MASKPKPGLKKARKPTEADAKDAKSGDKDVQTLLESLDADLMPQNARNQQVKDGVDDRGARENEKELLGFLDELAAPRPSSRVERDRKPGPAVGRPDEKRVDLPKEAVVSIPSRPQSRTRTPVDAPVVTTGVQESQIPAGVGSRQATMEGGWLGTFWNTASSTIRQTSERGKHLAQTLQTSAEGQYLQSHIKQNLSTITSLSSSLINTLAPPIGTHEQLHVHTYHDMTGYPDVENVAYAIFERVMSQVEGGELIVQSGKGGARRNSTAGRRELNACAGRKQAEKLARATLEKVPIPAEGEDLDTLRKSDIYVSVQPSIHTMAEEDGEIDADPEKFVSFVVYLLDPVHGLEFVTFSQSLPYEWVTWYEAGQDWIGEWVEETIALGIGVVAQRYVAKRMGVGDDKGKEKAKEMVGEMARAGV